METPYRDRAARDPFPAMTWDEIYDTVREYKMAWWRFPSRRSWKTFPIHQSAFARLRSTGINYDMEVKVSDLGVWCFRQREAKKGRGGYTITDDQIHKLNSILFQWDPSDDIF